MPGPYRFLGTSVKVWLGLLAFLFALALGIAYVPSVFEPFINWVVPRVRAAVSSWSATSAGEALRTLAVYALGLAFAPGALLSGFVLVWILRYPSFPTSDELGPLWTLVVVAAVISVSWVFWSTAISRTLHALGLWDPFWKADFHGRRWALRAFVALGDAWEKGFRFGRGPTAGWASFVEVLSNRFLDGDIFLGRPRLPVGEMLRPIGIPTEKHMVTIAGTGSGKSTAALIPNLCIHEGSLLCVDPKGELATITATRRGAGGNGVRGMGQDVFVLDPIGIVRLPGESASYNVFDEMARIARSDPGRPVSYASTIARALVPNVSGHQPFWDESARRVIEALVLYVFICEPPERRHLVRMNELLWEGDVEEHAARVARGEIADDELSPWDVLIEKMLLARNQAPPCGAAVVRGARFIEEMEPKVRQDVLTTARQHTAFLGLPEFQRISRHSDFLLDDLKTSYVSVYLCLPVNLVGGLEGRWLRMFVLLFTDMMIRQQDPPEPPVLLAIDEFPSLGTLESMEHVAPMMRSYGVRLWAVGQDIEQFKKAYPQSWGGFIGGAEAVQFMGLKHPDTVVLLSELLGIQTITVAQRQGGKVVPVQAERQLLDADQVARMLAPDGRNQIIWRGDRKPMLLKLTPYYEYLPGWYYAPDPRFRESWRRRFWRAFAQPVAEEIEPPPAAVFTPEPEALEPARETARDSVEAVVRRAAPEDAGPADEAPVAKPEPQEVDRPALPPDKTVTGPPETGPPPWMMALVKKTLAEGQARKDRAGRKPSMKRLSETPRWQAAAQTLAAGDESRAPGKGRGPAADQAQPYKAPEIPLVTGAMSEADAKEWLRRIYRGEINISDVATTVPGDAAKASAQAAQTEQTQSPAGDDEQTAAEWLKTIEKQVEEEEDT